jgi:LCP family protein required for cell wall assembly
MSSYSNQSMAHPPRKKAKFDKLTIGLLAAFGVVGIVLAIVAGNFVFNLIKGWNLTSLPGAPVDSGATTVNSSATTPVVNAPSDAPVAAKAWDGNSRVNILFMGLDYSTARNAGEPWVPLTDTMILVTIDPLSKTTGMLSIRRDLWVNIPGYDYGKINTAYSLGVVNQLPGGGPGLAMKTVEQFLGVPINYYAQVDLDSFVTLIDEIKGVKLDIPERILLSPRNRGAVWVEPGVQVLDGELALAYARNRYTSGGDVDRGNRQLQVIKAIIDRITTFDMLPTLIANAPTLYNSVSKGIQTNLSLTQTIQLGTLILGMPKDNIKTYNIDYSQVTEENVGGLDVLRPIPDQIRILRDKVFANDSGAAAPIVMQTSDALTLAKSENARVEVLNGTTVAGLADTTASYLKNQGLNIVNTGNSDQNYVSTTIILHSDTPYTLAYLTELMKVPNTRIYRKLDAASTSDITVYVGSDWANSNPMP